MQGKKKILITFFSVISILFGLTGAVASFEGIFVLNSYEESFDNIHDLSLSVAGAIEKMLDDMESGKTTIAKQRTELAEFRECIESA